jgi:hypothetical protein
MPKLKKPEGFDIIGKTLADEPDRVAIYPWSIELAKLLHQLTKLLEVGTERLEQLIKETNDAKDR